MRRQSTDVKQIAQKWETLQFQMTSMWVNHDDDAFVHVVFLLLCIVFKLVQFWVTCLDHEEVGNSEKKLTEL